MQKSLAINPYNLADFTIVGHFPKEIHAIMRIYIAICFGEPTGRIRPISVIRNRAKQSFTAETVIEQTS